MRKSRHSLMLVCVLVTQLGALTIVEAKPDPDDFQTACVVACAMTGAAVGSPAGAMGALEGASIGGAIGGPLCKSIRNHLGITRRKQCKR